ncbi:MAG: SIMPL domain-containing protein [Caulobacterales bacterium]
MKSRFVAFAFAASCLFALPAVAQVIAPLKPYDPAIVRVAGRSELYLPPDQARITVSFYAPGKTPQEATDAVAGRARALDAKIKAIAPGKTVVERTDFAVRPVMKAGGDKKPDQVRGYEATASVTALIKDLELLGKAMDAAVNSDPDTFNGVEFSIADTQAARRKARKAAIEDAVDKAKLYVEGAGFRLGRLLLVEEGGNSMIVQSGNRAIAYAPIVPTAGDMSVTPPPVAPEPQLYTSEVTIVYEIGGALGAAR